jgi:hypothetical protein
MGRGASVMHTDDVTLYAEMMQHVFDRLDWNGDEFEVLPCRISCPVIPAAAALRFDLPEAPTA